MTWHQVTTGEQGTHRGVFARGRLLTDCEAAFPASRAVRLTVTHPIPVSSAGGCGYWPPGRPGSAR